MHFLSLLVGLLFAWIGWIEQAEAQGANKYYTGPGNYTGYCPIGTCSVAAAACQPYQYVSGCAFNSTGTCTNYTGVTPGKYFSGSSGLGLSNSEGVQSLCTPCGAGQSNPGCSASSAGSCVVCSPALLPANNYWTVPPNATVVCPYAAQTVAGPGFQTVGANATFPGTIIACAALNPGFYWPVPLLPTESCTTLAQTTCLTAGQKNVGYNSTFPGTCTPCTGLVPGTYYIANTAYNSNCPTTVCVDDCGVGKYRSGCTGANSGICTVCSNGNVSQVYVTSGNWTNSCQVAGCVKTCPTGQYISNCGTDGVTTATLTCGICNNNVANVNFYFTQGSYTPGSCTVTPCRTCDSGNYLIGCGSVSSNGLASGNCTTCTNTVY